MFKIDQITAANEAAIEQFNHFAKLSLANVEKLASLGLAATRESVAEASAHAQALAGARDVQEVIALQTAALQPALKRAYAVSRTAFETAAETGGEVKRVFEAQSADLNKTYAAAFEEAFKYAPAGSEPLVGNVKTALSAAQTAFENIASLNQRFYDTVEAAVEENVATVTGAAAKAKRTTKRK